MADFCMPSLGADMAFGTVTHWLVKPGDRVKRGDVVVEVETDKAAMEVEIFQDGVIGELLVPEGERVAVGTPLARLEVPAGVAAVVGAPAVPSPTEAVAPLPPPPLAQPAHRQQATPTARALAAQHGLDLAGVRGTGLDGLITRADVERLVAAPRVAETARLRVSPYARRLAAEAGVDLSSVTGSGGGGAVRAEDVRKPASGQLPPGRVDTAGEQVSVPARPVPSRGPLVALMERANREIPHYYLELEIDVSPALKWLEAENGRRPVTERILPAALLLKAVALACRDVPEMNGHWTDGEFHRSEAVHLGVAISLRTGGVVAPAILDAANRTLDDVMAGLRDLAGRARGGRLRASELSSGTITVTNLGELGVDSVFGVIFPPQVALVGFGRIREQPWAENGMLGVRPVVRATLSADHRSSDGHRGGMFLAAINRHLQEPESL